MIPWAEVTGSKELCYTWRCDVTGVTRMWLIGRMLEWLPTSGTPVRVSSVDPARAEWFLENRGIETPRLEWLIRHPEKLMEPQVLLRLPCPKSPEFPEGWSDLTLDGHHRYVTLAAVEFPLFKFYHLDEETASQFEVSDVPQLREETFNAFVTSGNSGIDHDA